MNILAETLELSGRQLALWGGLAMLAVYLFKNRAPVIDWVKGLIPESQPDVVTTDTTSDNAWSACRCIQRYAAEHDNTKIAEALKTIVGEIISHDCEDHNA